MNLCGRVPNARSWTVLSFRRLHADIRNRKRDPTQKYIFGEASIACTFVIHRPRMFATSAPSKAATKAYSIASNSFQLAGATRLCCRNSSPSLRRWNHRPDHTAYFSAGWKNESVPDSSSQRDAPSFDQPSPESCSEPPYAVLSIAAIAGRNPTCYPKSPSRKSQSLRVAFVAIFFFAAVAFLFAHSGR